MANENLVSIIIPAYNSEITLGNTLDSIKASTYPQAEIIIVDDCSTDNTCKVAAAYDCSLIRCEKNMGIGFCRNRGAEAARGEFLFFTDADVCLQKDAIELGVTTLLANADISAVIGSFTKHSGVSNVISRYKQLVLHHIHQTAREDTFLFVGFCSIIRKQVFTGIGGFNQTLFNWIGEDIDLGARLYDAGYKIFLHKKMLAVHYKRYGFFDLLYNDTIKRAIPWTYFLLTHKFLKFDVCTKIEDLLSIITVYLILAAVGLTFFQPYFGMVFFIFLILIFGLLNQSLLKLFFKINGLKFAFFSFILRLIYYFLSSIGSIAGICFYYMKGKKKLYYSR